MITLRREMDCPEEGRIVLDEACCPVCRKPLEPADGATHERWGYGCPPEDNRVLSFCASCPTDERDQTPAYEVTWKDTPQEEDGEPITHRAETARLIGVFTAEAELVRNLDEVEAELFRLCFPELAGDWPNLDAKAPPMVIDQDSRWQS